MNHANETFNTRQAEKIAFAMAEDRGHADSVGRSQPPAHAACNEAIAAGELLRKIAEELRSRLTGVLQPEGPEREAASQTRPHHGGSPIAGSFMQLARTSESTAAVLTDILRRLEV